LNYSNFNLHFRPTSAAPAPQVEAELSDEAATELVIKVISEEEQKQILNNNWKERLAGLQAASRVCFARFLRLLFVRYANMRFATN